MASEYLKQKYKDVKPDVPRELTKEEKRRNWWDYHKWYVAGGVVGVLILASMIWDMAGRGQPKPDYQVAYVGRELLPEDTVAALETAFASMGEDLNGDGQVVVRVRYYRRDPEGDASSVTATEVQLIADVSECESFIFLLEDPEAFQQSYHALCYVDGTLPEEDDDSVDGVALRWADCPALAGLDLGRYDYDLLGGEFSGYNQELLSDVYVARRGFWNSRDVQYQDGYLAFWDSIIAGAAA